MVLFVLGDYLAVFDLKRLFVAVFCFIICGVWICRYVFPRFTFDNLRGVDKEKLLALSAMYGNRQLVSRVKDVIQNSL